MSEQTELADSSHMQYMPLSVVLSKTSMATSRCRKLSENYDHTSLDPLQTHQICV